MTPTMPPRGSENVRSSISSLSPKPLRRLSASTTTSPSRVAGRDVDLDLVELDVALLGDERLEVAAGAPSAWSGGPSGSGAPSRARRRSCAGAPSRCAPRARRRSCFCSSQLGVVALVGDARGRGRARGSSRRRCRGSSDRGSRPRRCPCTRPGGARATPTDSASRWLVGSSSSSRSGAREQQPAERDAAALAAGQLGDVGVGRRQAQRVHRVLERGVEVPRVGGVDAAPAAAANSSAVSSE